MIGYNLSLVIICVFYSLNVKCVKYLEDLIESIRLQRVLEDLWINIWTDLLKKWTGCLFHSMQCADLECVVTSNSVTVPLNICRWIVGNYWSSSGQPPAENCCWVEEEPIVILQMRRTLDLHEVHFFPSEIQKYSHQNLWNTKRDTKHLTEQNSLTFTHDCLCCWHNALHELYEYEMMTHVDSERCAVSEISSIFWILWWGEERTAEVLDIQGLTDGKISPTSCMSILLSGFCNSRQHGCVGHNNVTESCFETIDIRKCALEITFNWVYLIIYYLTFLCLSVGLTVDLRCSGLLIGCMILFFSVTRQRACSALSFSISFKACLFPGSSFRTCSKSVNKKSYEWTCDAWCRSLCGFCAF